MSHQHPSDATRRVLVYRQQVVEALRAIADRVERGKGYYSEVTLQAFEERSSLPAGMITRRDGPDVYRVANPKFIAFTLSLSETPDEWLAQMLQSQWRYPDPPAPTQQPEPPFNLTSD